MDRWGVNATVVPHIGNLSNPSTAQVSDRDDTVQDEKGSARRLIDSTSFGVSSVRVKFHCQILNELVYLVRRLGRLIRG